MQPLLSRVTASPLLVRVVPFLVFLVLTFCQGQIGEASRYWCYLAKTVLGAWLIVAMWPHVTEMRWAISWEAVVVGVAVFGIWVGSNDYYPKLMKPDAVWNPH